MNRYSQPQPFTVLRTAAALLLGSFGLACAYLAVLAPSEASSVAVSSGDTAPRDFCGRLVIVFNGAGHRQSFEAPMEAIAANAANKMFIGDRTVPAAAIIFSSDPLVRESSHTTNVVKRGAAILLPASLESWAAAASSNGYFASLKRRLAASEPCKARAKAGEDVSRYLKIEIIVSSHSARDRNSQFRGLPVFAKDGEQGSDVDHALNQGPVLTQQSFQPLLSLFPDALFHVLVWACDGVDVASMISPHAASGAKTVAPTICYSAVSARGVLAPVRGDVPLSPGEQDDMSHVASHFLAHSTDGKWTGAESLHKLALSTFDYYRSFVRLQDSRRGGESLFAAGNSVKPYDKLSQSSLDALVENVTNGNPEHEEAATIRIRRQLAQLEQIS